MARKRIIDPNIWESEDFALLSMLGKVLFIGLFSIADDEGRGKANPVYIRSKLFPFTAEEVRLADIKNALSEIAQRMSVTFYTVNGTQYYALTHWELWQKIDRPSPSNIPSPEDGEPFDEDSTNARRTLDEHSTNPRRVLDEGSSLIEKNRKEENRTEENTPRARGFDEFWEHYPRKEAKAPARREWERLDPDDKLMKKILDDIERKRGSPQWKDDGGRYIPLPKTYLHQRRWEDIGIQGLSHGYEEHPADDFDHLLTNLDE